MFSLRRADRERLQQSRVRRDRILLALISSPRRLLVTVLIGNECTNVAVSAVVAGMMDRYYGGSSDWEAGLAATACALPILLFLGEITPKSIAMSSAVSWSRRVARPLYIFSVLVTPLRFVVRGIADLILAPFGGVHPTRDGEISEEEFRVLVDAGTTDGEVDDRERRLIHKVFEFGDKTVGQAMQPWEQVFSLPYELPLAQLTKEIGSRGYSRVPIYHRSTDDIRGVLYAKDLVTLTSRQRRTYPLTDLLHEPLFIPRSTPVQRLFSVFKKGVTHMAFVVNEYGRVVGIVTMEDLLEELFGEIRDEREMQKQRTSQSMVLPEVGRQEAQ